MSLSVHPVKARKDLKRFVLFPWQIYRNDPIWVPPLISERLQFLNPRKNPFFEHGEAQLFLAKRDGEIVGRISAHIDDLHNKTHHEKTGFFGFFESINDQAVASSLLDTAADWLRDNAMESIRGPFSFNINHECGILIDGFQYPPYVMMPHNPPYYANLLETMGFTKLKDLFCWTYDYTQPIPKILQLAAKKAGDFSDVTFREIKLKSMKKDVYLAMDIFNSAWQENWGFIPFTKSEVEKLAKDFKIIIEPRLAFIAELNHQPIAVCIALPNLNEVIKDLNGRLFPFGFFKLLYRLKRQKWSSTRVVVLGIYKKFQMSHESATPGILAVIAQENYHRSTELSVLKCEGSWTLEDNQNINNVARRLGAQHYKTYRIYENEIA